jgi:hypothetical protein
MPVTNAEKQARYRRRRNAGLISISLDVDPELLAMALNNVGIRVTQGRADLKRGVNELLIGLLLRVTRQSERL